MGISIMLKSQQGYWP